MNRPLVWVAAALVSGVGLAAYGILDDWIAPATVLVLTLVLAPILPARFDRRTFLVVVPTVAAGALLYDARHAGPPGDDLSRHLEQHRVTSCEIEGKVRRADLIVPGAEYASFTIDATKLRVGRREWPLEGGVAVRWYDPGGQYYPGERVRARGIATLALGHVNPGLRDVEDFYRGQGVHTGLRAQGGEAIRGIAPAHWWSPPYLAARLRYAIALRLSEVTPRHALDFVYAVWLGERRGIAQQAQENYIVTGTAHILAVSGLHTAIIYASTYGLLRLFLRRRRARAVITMVVILLFAFMTGARVSSLRAAIMIILYLSADLFDREPDASTALSIAGIVFLIWNPDILFDTGALLSFSSVASLLIFRTPFADLLERLPYLLRNGLSATLAVQIVPMPIAVSAFHVLPIYAPVTNLLIVPLLGVALWICFLTTLLAFVFPPAATLFGHALLPLVGAIELVASGVAALPFSHAMLTSPTLLAAVAYWAAALCLLLALRRVDRRKRLLAAATACLMISAIVWRPFHAPAEAVFLDVGRGDATYIRTPGGSNVLVDTGDRNEFVDIGARVVAPFLWSRGITRLDHLIITHADRDHIGGALFLVEHFAVGNVVLAAVESNRELEGAFEQACAKRGVPFMRARRGDTLAVAGASIEVLNPASDKGVGSTNNSSLVLRVQWPGFSLLLPGDIETPAETELRPLLSPVDVLKAPHHGSSTSSTPSFLDTLHPAHAIASAGTQGGYEFIPHETPARYADAGIQFWRTDRQGAISVRARGNTIEVRAERQFRGYPIAKYD